MFDYLEMHLDASGIENDDVQVGRAVCRTGLAGLAKLLGVVGLVRATCGILHGQFIKNFNML